MSRCESLLFVLCFCMASSFEFRLFDWADSLISTPILHKFGLTKIVSKIFVWYLKWEVLSRRKGGSLLAGGDGDWLQMIFRVALSYEWMSWVAKEALAYNSVWFLTVLLDMFSSLRRWLDHFLTDSLRRAICQQEQDRIVIDPSNQTMSDGSDKELKFQYLGAREMKVEDVRCVHWAWLRIKEGIDRTYYCLSGLLDPSMMRLIA